jgi:hypothetical protein
MEIKISSDLSDTGYIKSIGVSLDHSKNLNLWNMNKNLYIKKRDNINQWYGN